MLSHIGDLTSANNQLYYIYYYYDISTKPSIKHHTKEILNPITDTNANLQVTSRPLESYFHRLMLYSRCWWCWWYWSCCCCCCCCCCRGRDGRPALRQNSWESHASFSSSNKAVETIKRIVVLLNQLLQHVFKEVLIKAALSVVRLCHHWVRTSWVDCTVWYSAHINYHLAWTSREDVWTSASRRWNSSVHALLTTGFMFLVSHICCAPPPGPNTGGTKTCLVSRLTDNGVWLVRWGQWMSG